MLTLSISFNLPITFNSTNSFKRPVLSCAVRLIRLVCVSFVSFVSSVLCVICVVLYISCISSIPSILPPEQFTPYPFQIFQVFDSYNTLNGSSCSSCSILDLPTHCNVFKSISLSLQKCPTGSKCLTRLKCLKCSNKYGVYGEFKRVRNVRGNCVHITP